jgi:hypothetical protein
VPRSLARATQIITGSESSRHDIATRHGVAANRITVIPVAALPTFRPSSSDATTRVLSRYGLKPGLVFTVSCLKLRKNLSRLIDACTLLRQSGFAELQLVIAGKPDFGAQAVLRPRPSSTLSSSRDSGFPSWRRWRAARRWLPPTAPQCPSCWAMRACWSTRRMFQDHSGVDCPDYQRPDARERAQPTGSRTEPSVLVGGNHATHAGRVSRRGA